MNLRRHIFPLAFVATFPAWEVAADPIELKAIPQQEQGSVVPGVNPDARCFAIEVTIDPAEVEGGDFLAVASIAVGLSGQDAGRTGNLLMLDLREGNRRGAFTFWHRNINLTNALPNPKPAGWKDNGEYQHPNQFMLREGEG